MIPSDASRVFPDLSTAVGEGRSVVLATIVETEGSVPRHPGTKMLVYPDGSTTGTIGGGKVELAIRDDALGVLADGRPAVRRYDLHDPEQGDPGVCGGTMTVYLEAYMSPQTLFVIGCGHVGKAVVDLAHWLGYRTIAIDDRSERVTPEAMPSADVRFDGSVAEALAAHPVTEDSSIVVVTRSHDIDAEITPILLATDARYIGVMGSKRRWEATSQLIVDGGVSEEDLERIHNPIGLDIGAESVEEIAVSIMSEVIEASAQTSQ
ncbi:MAG: XdhC family protein [Acidimicrobiia bacterium]